VRPDRAGRGERPGQNGSSGATGRVDRAVPPDQQVRRGWLVTLAVPAHNDPSVTILHVTEAAYATENYIASPRLLRLSGKKEGLTLEGVRSGQGERHESVAIGSTPSDPRSLSATIGVSDDTGAPVVLTHERPLASAALKTARPLGGARARQA
jgi:hypothetical protein